MKRKILIALLAGAIGLHGATVSAQEAPAAEVTEEAVGSDGAEEAAEAAEAVDAAEGEEAAEPAPEVAEEEPEEELDISTAYIRELLTLEEDVNSLKESVFRSKATLQLLKEIVIEGSTTGSRVALWHVNELGAGYTVISVTYFLNGQPVFTRTDQAGGLDETEEIKIWEGALPPGDHSISVSALLRGNGFGVFSYVEDYSFNVRSNYTFEAEDNHLSTVRVLLNERPGIGRSFVERPQVVYEVQATRLSEGE